MEDYIQISKINDFIFCPKSIYFHGLYDGYTEKTYHDTPQVLGKIKHTTIDEGTYSSSTRYLQGTMVYSERFGLCGKIDIYDRDTQSLIERKTKVSTIYDGYRFQLYAQMFGLEEMGFPVKHLFIHSLTDNKRYPIELPTGKELEHFTYTIQKMRTYDMLEHHRNANPAKCARCIYKALCH